MKLYSHQWKCYLFLSFFFIQFWTIHFKIFFSEWLIATEICIPAIRLDMLLNILNIKFIHVEQVVVNFSNFSHKEVVILKKSWSAFKWFIFYFRKVPQYVLEVSIWITNFFSYFRGLRIVFNFGPWVFQAKPNLT